ncbi:hypothetical protein MBLNU13_g07222t1 [Cladosporium sp. NU13]
MAPTANNNNARLHVRQQIQQDIASCARPCFDYFVSEFPCDGDDLECLCSQRSSQGFTLGEFAYSCSQTECTTVSKEDAGALYNICSGVKSAAKPTLSGTITLPGHPASYIVTTTPSSTSAVATSTANPQTTSSPTEVHASPSSRSSSTHAAATGAPLVFTNDGSKEATSLTSGQAVGISIGAMGGLCLAGALIYLLLWCKRRRAFKSPKPRNDSFDFIDKGAPRHSPFRHGHADPRGPLGGFAKPRVELDDGAMLESRWYERLNNGMRPGQTVRLQQNSDRSVSPESRSQESPRTVSQLLPEKAGQTPPQPPYKSPRAASVFSTATVFEEDGKTPKLLSPATMLPMPVAPKPVLKTVPRRPERPTFSAIFSTSPVDIRNPQSVASSPTKSVRKELTPSPLRHLPLPPPPVPTHSSTAAGRPLSSEFRVSTHRSLQPPSSVPSYLPEYYASNESRTPIFDIMTPPRRRPVPPPSRPIRSTQPPRSYRCSGGSETSFESTDPDEITPPEEIDRHLSPVPEADSPNSNVKYPKVPRSSNQAVPRSPKPTLSPAYQHSQVWPLKEQGQGQAQTPPPPPKHTTQTPKTPLQTHHQPSLSGSTLAAKRLGSSAATSLSNGLHIRSLSNPQSSPLKGYGRPANSNSNNSVRGPRPRPPVSLRKPSYAGTGYGSPDPEYDLPPRTPEMASAGPKILRTEREVVLRSPLWEPKLTPSRRGEDLFLSVSLASPGVEGPGGAGGAGMELGRR